MSEATLHPVLREAVEEFRETFREVVMGYKSKRFGVTKVDLGDGYWVEVAPLTKAEDDECNRILLGGDLEGTVGDAASMRAKFHQREYTDQLLVCAIKRWNLDDEAGVLLPITAEAIQGLADTDSTKLLAVVRGITNPVAEPATAKN